MKDGAVITGARTTAASILGAPRWLLPTSAALPPAAGQRAPVLIVSIMRWSIRSRNCRLCERLQPHSVVLHLDEVFGAGKLPDSPDERLHIRPRRQHRRRASRP